MKKDTLDLMGLAVTISIFLPLVINYFYNLVNSNKTNYLSLRYLFLPGFFLLIYCIIYWRDINNKTINQIIFINLFLIGLSTIYLSIVPEIPPINILFLFLIINTVQGALLFSSFVLFPILLFLYVCFQNK
jgi:hypothetical protein